MTSPVPNQAGRPRGTRPLPPPPVAPPAVTPPPPAAVTRPSGRPGPPGHPAAGDPHEAQKPDRTARRTPSFPAEALRITTLADPVLDRLGHDPRSTYVERFWLPILGPSCLLLLRRLAAEQERHPEGFTLATAQWAQEMGVGMKGGKNGPLWRAIERACRFGAAQRNGELLAVRRRLPPLTARQVERLPAELQQAHAHWVEDRLAKQKRPTVTKWSPRRDQIGRPLPVLGVDKPAGHGQPDTPAVAERLDDAA